MTINAHGLVDWYPASDADDPGSASQRGQEFFSVVFSFFFLSYLFIFYFFYLTSWIRVFSQINNCQQKNKQTNKTKRGGLRF